MRVHSELALVEIGSFDLRIAQHSDPLGQDEDRGLVRADKRRFGDPRDARLVAKRCHFGHGTCVERALTALLLLRRSQAREAVDLRIARAPEPWRASGDIPLNRGLGAKRRT